jgi:hypothetical protein
MLQNQKIIIKNSNLIDFNLKQFVVLYFQVYKL